MGGDGGLGSLGELGKDLASFVGAGNDPRYQTVVQQLQTDEDLLDSVSPSSTDYAVYQNRVESDIAQLMSLAETSKDPSMTNSLMSFFQAHPGDASLLQQLEQGDSFASDFTVPSAFGSVGDALAYINQMLSNAPNS